MQADWDNLALGVLYSSNNAKLTTITDVLQNPTASLGATGQGGAAEHLSCIRFEKLLLVDLNDARRVKRRSALQNMRRDNRGPLLLRCLYREGGQGHARVPCKDSE